MRLQHQLDTYKDGYRQIAFCKICSAEGEKLQSECVGIQEEDILKNKLKNLWSDIDRFKLNR